METTIYIAEQIFGEGSKRDPGTRSVVVTYNKYKAKYIFLQFVLEHMKEIAKHEFRVVLREIITIPDLRITPNPKINTSENVETDAVINMIKANMLDKIQNTYEIMTSDDVINIFLKEDYEKDRSKRK